MGRMTRHTAIALALVLGGCSEGSTPEATFGVADSAGVEVVTSSTPSWPEGRSPWTLSLVTEIGLLDGDEAYLFGDPEDVALIPGGEIAVADNQTADVRFYDESGEFLRRVGTRGEGPGEFQSFDWLGRCGAGLMAHDRRLRRTTTISFSGEVGDPEPFETPEEGRPPYRSTCLPDGSLLAVGWGEAPPRPDGAERWLFTQRADLWRIVPGESMDTIGTYISSERLGIYDPRSGGGGSGPHPFSRSVAFAGDSDHLYIGGAERLQVEVRSLDGELLRIVRGPDSELEMTDEFMARYRSAELDERGESLRDDVTRTDEAMPDRYPAYSDLMVDDLGFLWVERFALPWAEIREWGVFAPDGVFLGHLEVPVNFRATDVSADRIAGIATDELGVARIRIYDLDREGAP